MSSKKSIKIQTQIQNTNTKLSPLLNVKGKSSSKGQETPATLLKMF